MDLDDLIEDLIPKKKLKKLKKKLKKKSLWRIFFGWLVALFSSQPSDKRIEKQSKKREKERRDKETPIAREQDPLVAGLEQAQAYRMQIEAMALAAPPDSVERMRLDMLSEKVADWTIAIAEIVERTLHQEEDTLLASERKRVPAAIKRLEKQLDDTKDEALKQKLERTLDNRRKQLAQLEQTATNRQMAALKIENTLAQLGIIYSQLHSGRYMSERGEYERLSAEINEEVYALGDYLDALKEING